MRNGRSASPGTLVLALLHLLSAMLLVAGCVGSAAPAGEDASPSVAPPLEVAAGKAQTTPPTLAAVTDTLPPPTVTPIPQPTRSPSATATSPAPTATFVPLLTPSATATGSGRRKADVPRVGVPDALFRVTAGQAILVDVRTRGTYDRGHIAGAISIPYEEVAERHRELPLDKLVIFY